MAGSAKTLVVLILLVVFTNAQFCGSFDEQVCSGNGYYDCIDDDEVCCGCNMVGECLGCDYYSDCPEDFESSYDYYPICDFDIDAGNFAFSILRYVGIAIFFVVVVVVFFYLRARRFSIGSGGTTTTVVASPVISSTTTTTVPMHQPAPYAAPAPMHQPAPYAAPMHQPAPYAAPMHQPAPYAAPMHQNGGYDAPGHAAAYPDQGYDPVLAQEMGYH
eukprot:TRINITY_DN542_c0_g1_i1.p1 TRINITY_DN542_c0_g1~~TRINITY_DN542_c0_g1_i1.p1  ORF type:complete len:217 (+),score=32.28 TRINITY_DN542_c0_g1_i1:66-716(+)